MSYVVNLLKRRCFPATVAGQDVFLRALTLKEGIALDAADADKRALYAVGKSLCNPDGSPVYMQAKEETNEVFIERISGELADLPQDVLYELLAAINQITTAPPMDKLKKN